MPNIDFLLKFCLFLFLFIYLNFILRSNHSSPPLLFYFKLHICVHLFVGLYMCMLGHRRSQRHWIPLELELLAIVSYAKWVLGIQLGSSEKQQNLSHQSITPVCDLYFEMIASNISNDFTCSIQESQTQTRLVNFHCQYCIITFPN